MNESGQKTGQTLYTYQDIKSIVGFEFDIDNSDIFFVSAIDLSFQPDIYFQDDSNPLTLIQGQESYWSHIELGRDGRMYFSDLQGNMASLNPAVTPYTISGSFGSTTIHSNNNNAFARVVTLDGFYTLPDQIDGEENVYFKDPISNFDLNGTNLPTTFSSSLPDFNICSILNLTDLSLYGDDYQVTLYQLNSSGQVLQTPPTQPFLASLNSNIKSIPFDFQFNTLQNINNTGIYKIIVNVRNICGIVNSKTGFFTVSQPLINLSPITINGELPSQSLPPGPGESLLNVFSCSTQTITLDDNGWNGIQYRLRLQSTDINGNVISGSPYLGTTLTAWTNDFSSLQDLKDIPATNGDWLTDDAHAGYYKVTLEVWNQCGQINTFSGFMLLNAPPSAVNMSLAINNGLTGLLCNSKSTSSMCLTGNLSGAFSLGIGTQTFSTNNIESFKRKIEEVNCISGVSLPGPPLFEDLTTVTPSNPNAPIVGLSFAGLAVQGNPLFFTTKQGNCYKLTVEVFNPCSSASDWTFFQIDPAQQYLVGNNGNNPTINANPNNSINSYNKVQFNKQNNRGSETSITNEKYDLATEVSFYPNPVRNILTIKLNGSLDFNASIKILDQLGRLVLDATENKSYGHGVNAENIDVSNLTTGVYFLSVEMNGERTLSKIIKQ